jgi:hypothetical protein
MTSHVPWKKKKIEVLYTHEAEHNMDILLYCLFFFDMRIMITPLISSSSSGSVYFISNIK